MISIGLNLILGLLLFCALVLGMRLERRLRGLRQSHLDFTKAVGELDQAAVRTESSLAALRAGSEAVRTELAARIDQARLACQRLETLIAAHQAAQPLALSQPVGQTAPQMAAPVTAPRAVMSAPPLAQTGQPAFARTDALRPAAPVQIRPPQPATPRSRALVDDDLFDAGPAPDRRSTPAARMGGRR